MNRRALERGDLCASFEPYSNLVRGVVASLSLKMYSLFFEKVVGGPNFFEISISLLNLRSHNSHIHV